MGYWIVKKKSKFFYVAHLPWFSSDADWKNVLILRIKSSYIYQKRYILAIVLDFAKEMS